MAALITLRQGRWCSRLELSIEETESPPNVSLAQRNAVWLEVSTPQGFVTKVNGASHRQLEAPQVSSVALEAG